MDQPPNREQAQQRIDRIHAFQKEMAALQSERILEISQEDQDLVSQYHSRLIDDFSNRFYVDIIAANYPGRPMWFWNLTGTPIRIGG